MKLPRQSRKIVIAEGDEEAGKRRIGGRRRRTHRQRCCGWSRRRRRGRGLGPGVGWEGESSEKGMIGMQMQTMELVQPSRPRIKCRRTSQRTSPVTSSSKRKTAGNVQTDWTGRATTGSFTDYELFFLSSFINLSEFIKDFLWYLN